MWFQDLHPKLLPDLWSGIHLPPPRNQDQDLEEHLNCFQLIWMTLKIFKWQKADQYQKIYGTSGMTH